MKRILQLLFLTVITVVIVGGAVQAQSTIGFCSMSTCNFCDPPPRTPSGDPIWCYCDDIEWLAVTCDAYCEGACN
jgi:hypothetical protein